MSSSTDMIRKDMLLKHLEEKNILWSYDSQKLNSLPDSIVIEHALLYADVEDLKLLFQAFPIDTIRKVWLERLVPHSRNHKVNCYLGTFFFLIPDIRTFLNERTVTYPRLERLSLLAAAD